LSELFTIPEEIANDQGAIWERLVLVLVTVWQAIEENNPKLSTTLISLLLSFRSPKPIEEIREELKIPFSQTMPAVKDLLLQSDLLVAGASEEEITSLIRKTGGKLELMSHQIAILDVEKTLLWFYEHGEFIDESGELLIQLPMTKKEAMAIVKERYRSLAGLTEIYFGGLTITYHDREGKPKKAVLVLSDTPDATIEHERTHRDNPGLQQGQLGVSLNEGLTNYLAGLRLPADQQPISYPEEKELLSQLPQSLFDALVKRYQQNDLDSVRSAACLLLDALGPKAYLSLYRAYPQKIYTSAMHARGYLPVTEVTHILKA
jgi:hypothetical protein